MGRRVIPTRRFRFPIHQIGALRITRPTRRTPRSGLTVALLWTLHPLQTEAVTYIIQRTESLMGLFFLLTFYCFSRALRRRDRGRGAC